MKDIYYCLVSGRPIVIAEEDIEEKRFEDFYIKAKKAYMMEVVRQGSNMFVNLGVANNIYLKCDAIYILDEKDPLYIEIRSKLSGIKIVSNNIISDR